MRLLLLALLGAAAATGAQTRAVTARAQSDAPFLTGGAEAPGEGSVFEGETLASYYLPVWIDYHDGSRYVLGVGSEARLWTDRLEFQGVSLEIVSPGPLARSIFTASLELRPSADCQATIYADRNEAATAYVATGSIEVYDSSGVRVGAVSPNEAKTIARIEGEWRVQENRGPLEMARILLRELNYTFRLEEVVPPYGRKRRELVDRLMEASGGVLLLDAEVRGFQLSAEGQPVKEETTTIDPQILMREAAAVSRELHHAAGWDRYGCGKPACLSRSGLIAGRPFSGDARLMPPQPSGCLLCEQDAPVAP